MFGFYLFICYLFNAMSSSDFMVLNDRRVTEKRIGKNMEGSTGCDLI
jgi:hypothetical protein